MKSADHYTICNDLLLFTEAPTLSYRCLNDVNWTMLEISGPCEKMIGCSSNDLLTNKVTFSQLMDPLEARMIWYMVQKALEKKMPFQFVYKIKTLDNVTKLILEQGQGMFVDNNLIELQGFLTDITQYSKNASLSLNINSPDISIKDTRTMIQNVMIDEQKENKLSIREIEIIIHLCQGMTMKEIGAKLKISPRTVEIHINRAKLKLDCASKSELKQRFRSTYFGKKLTAML